VPSELEDDLPPRRRRRRERAVSGNRVYARWPCEELTPRDSRHSAAYEWRSRL